MKELFAEYGLTLITLVGGVVALSIIFIIFLSSDSSIANLALEYMEAFIK